MVDVPIIILDNDILDYSIKNKNCESLIDIMIYNSARKKLVAIGFDFLKNKIFIFVRR